MSLSRVWNRRAASASRNEHARECAPGIGAGGGGEREESDKKEGQSTLAVLPCRVNANQRRRTIKVSLADPADPRPHPPLLRILNSPVLPLGDPGGSRARARATTQLAGSHADTRNAVLAHARKHDEHNADEHE